MATVRPKEYRYITTVRWEKERMGTLSGEGKPDIAWATPPEFQGHPGRWSPEDLFVAAVNTCFLSTFITFSRRANLSWVAYECQAEGLLTLVEGRFMFPRVVLKPVLTLADKADSDKAKKVFQETEHYCLVSNSLKSTVTVEPTLLA